MEACVVRIGLWRLWQARQLFWTKAWPKFAYVRVEPCWQELPVGLAVVDPEHASAKKEKQPRNERWRRGDMAGAGYRAYRRATGASAFTSVVSEDSETAHCIGLFHD